MTELVKSHWASKRRNEMITKLVVSVLLVLGSIVMLFPIFWMVSTSFKLPNDVFAIPPVWIPAPLQLENYPHAWNLIDPQSGRGIYADDTWTFFGVTIQGINFTTYLVNTLVITVAACVGTTLSSSLVAFAFARLRFPGRDLLFLLCLATLMVPTQVTMIPTFWLFKTLGWYDTFYPLIVPAFLGGGAYNIFLMRQFFMSIPYEMDEAAKIDGCSDFGVFWRILLPLCKPALVRFRVLDQGLRVQGLDDMSTPIAQFARLVLPVRRVFITENEINGLAFPQAEASIIIFGLGYGVDRLGLVPWLQDKAIYYWGDLDTHGFAILDSLRGVFPNARSFLMDRQTLLGHRPLWVEEPEPSQAPLTRLTEDEHGVFEDLRFDRLGRRVRLEQERIAFGHVARTVAGLL